MILRQFNNSGIERFREELQKCRDNSSHGIDLNLLVEESFTVTVLDKVEVEVAEPPPFTTKGTAGLYLHALLDKTELTHDDIMSNTGLWSWLTLFFFDSVCPPDLQGRRKVRNDYTYIYDTSHRNYYRHLLFVSWRALDVAKQHGIDQKYCRLITTTRINTLDKVTTEIMKKLYLLRIPCIFEVLDRIYWDNIKNKSRKNIADMTIRRGNLTHRFPSVIQQLEKTYDLQNLEAHKLIDLLGDEFNFSPQ
jgi:hypothetical protein